MKFSEKWLREWIDIEIDSSVLYEQISSAGFEVEYIKKFHTQFTGVVTGCIVECKLHTIANNLKIVQVDIGKKKLLNIVCNALNCRSGIKVAVATVGAILHDKSVIDKKIIAGEISEGMLCSFFELGIFFKENKIIEFSQDIPIGMNVNNYLSLQDSVIKTSITSNRPDGLSILGISRNIAAINNSKKLSLKKITIPVRYKKELNITIQAKKECINFLGRIIRNINVNIDTPLWMKKKLFFSDMLSENIIVNIIHYVLIEIGQPLSIFDIDNIDDSIIIRMANHQENIFLKNKIKIELNKNILVFSDKYKILSLPGNINSIFSNISKNTKNIFLSSYLINKETILNLLKKIHSNKILEYYHYGVDSSLQNYALEYATKLILNICGGEPGIITYKENNLFELKKNTIRLYSQKIQKKIGIAIKDENISNILYNLDYKVNFFENYWDVIPPSWRFDILIEEDVINDIIRIYGYNNIILHPLKEHIKLNQKNESIDFLLKQISLILINRGYYEVINYSFIDPKIEYLIFKNKKHILISNPIAQDMSCMRSSLWPGLLKNISYNKNRQQKSMRIFEKGLCFSIDQKEHFGIKQEMFLSAIISGNYFKESWFIKKRKVDFYDLKGDLESIFDSMCISNNIEFKRESILGLHPEQSAAIYFKDYLIGKIGSIDPRLKKTLNVNSATFLFEISLKHFSHNPILKFQEISKFPTIRRDIAIIISEEIIVNDVIKTCKKFFIHQIVEINLFDIYSYRELSDTKRSLGISFVFQNQNRTLKDDEINLMIHDCIEILKNKFQVILRK